MGGSNRRSMVPAEARRAASTALWRTPTGGRLTLTPAGLTLQVEAPRVFEALTTAVNLTTRATPGPLTGDTSHLLEAVALGQIAALVPASLAATNQREDIAYRELAVASPYVIAAIWREGSRGPAIAAFVRAATDAARALPTA
ncbi:hypothetical protein AB0I28_03930 [Phytomonospora sp. NPDC050363]|uniref:LysR substrate-binding domain-containing protein n=1 Tax=Phytomonospora sp. NPDC050363 TaxID=3155642 RepID=UPI0033DEEF02